VNEYHRQKKKSHVLLIETFAQKIEAFCAVNEVQSD
jgi:hypothetical protein